MKRAPVVLVAAVCAFVALFTYCNDTPGGKSGRRIEPRLTAQPKSHSEPRTCGDFVVDDALEILVDHPKCIDTAIRFLEQRGEPADLAAAYYLNEEYLPALTTLLRRARPDDPIALYNQALTEEKLFLNDDAIESWKALLKLAPSDSEAKQHLSRLKPTATGIEAWEQNKQALRAALQRSDKAAMARLIEPFPSAAMRFFEEELVLENPAGIEVYAEVLSERLNGDRYPLDVVRAPKPKEGLEAFGRGVHAAGFKEAASAFANASQLLKRGGSPLYLTADIRYAKNREATGDRIALASATALTAQKLQYHHLLAQAHAAKASVLYEQPSYLKAQTAYRAAEAEYKRLRDSEGLGIVRTRIASAYYDTSQYDSAFKEMMTALPHIPQITELRHVNVLIGEAARNALDLGHPQVALHYQNMLIRVIQQLPEDVENIEYNLGTAFRERFPIQLALGDHAEAREDINRAHHLYGIEDPTALAAVNARLEELTGRTSLQEGRFAESITSFERALTLAPQKSMQTMRANLLAQLAEAQYGAQDPEAEQTLLEAVRIIHEEEKRQLEGRAVGEGEELWTPYFARFEEVYDRLIRILIDNGRSEDAFLHAERATAFEPLDLVLHRKDLPRGFREIAEAPTTVVKIQQHLPPGTVLLRFFVLDDRTYVWILTREQFTPITIKRGRDAIDRWVTDLQGAAKNNDDSAFATGLVAPYKELIEPALQDLEPTRLVIIPDTPLHGLPFAALRDQKNQRYLVHVAPLEFAGSALLYLFSLMRDEQLASRDESAFVVSDTSLTHAAHEADDVAALYERSKLIRDATAAQFLREAPDYTLLHVAAHAIPNPREPNHSYVRFAASPGDSGELAAQELLALNLKFTRLVVLSACSSSGAAGVPIGPEGVAPLVRPFLAAGVPAVVGTLWDVRDDTTESLLVSFHQTYGQHGDAAASLRAAQLQMLGAGQSVLAWAPFQVIGHTSPRGARRNGGTTIGNHRTDLLQRPDAVRSQ